MVVLLKKCLRPFWWLSPSKPRVMVQWCLRQAQAPGRAVAEPTRWLSPSKPRVMVQWCLRQAQAPRGAVAELVRWLSPSKPRVVVQWYLRQAQAPWVAVAELVWWLSPSKPPMMLVLLCLRQAQAPGRVVAEPVEATMGTEALASSGSRWLFPDINASFFFLPQPCTCFSRRNASSMRWNSSK